MKKKATHVISLLALLSLGAGAAAACPLVYTINFSGQFGLIDLATGVFSPVGKGLENTPSGLAGKASGPFYTVDGVTGHLLRIGNDGSVTDVGDTQTGPAMGPSGISLIGSTTNGTLYALDFSNRLYRINEKTGALTLLGFLPTLPVQIPQYDGLMTTSLTGTADKLYFTIEISDGPEKVGPNLYTIDLFNLAVTVNSLDEFPGRVIGSGFANGEYYLFGEGGEIYRLDLSTRKFETVASYDSGQVDGGPPFTGIFGIIPAIEPNGLPGKASEPVKTQSKSRRSAWPLRSSALPPRVCR